MPTTVNTEGENWNVAVTFHADTRPASARREDPPEGRYDVLCAKASIGYPKDDATKQKPYIRLDLKIEGPAGTPAIGMEFATFLNLPRGDANDKTSESFLKKTLIALGHSPDQIGGLAGPVPLGRGGFEQRRGKLFFRPAADRDSFAETVWLTTEEAAKVDAGELRIAVPKPRAAMAPPPAPAVPPGLGGGGSPSLGGGTLPSLGGANGATGSPAAGTVAAAVAAFLA